MSEFSVCLQGLTQQKNRLSSVEDAVKDCKRLVDDVNSHLGLIGIGGVSNSLSATSTRLKIHAKKCDELSDALIQITRKFQYTENSIAGTKTIQQIFEEFVQGIGDVFSPIEQPDYVGAIYLVNNEGAAQQGHAAVILVRADGSYEYYSYGSDGRIIADVLLPGISPLAEQMLQSGVLDTDITQTNFWGVNDPTKFDEYSNYVFIPISDEQGVAMHEYAQQLIDNPGDYNLLTNNCNMNAQAILEAGNLNFASTGFDFVATRPNTVYEQFLATVQANPDLYPGYVFGDVPGGDLSWLQTSDFQNLVNHDVNVAPITDITFYDPGEGLENFLNGFGNNIFGGTTTAEVSQYWNQGLSGNFFQDMQFINGHVHNANNYVIDTTQSGVNYGIDWVQENSTSAIDNFQNNYITGPFSGLVNGVIDGGQWLGNGVIDGGQWLGNGIIDTSQSIGDFLYDIFG